jgi:hypothetical protein
MGVLWRSDQKTKWFYTSEYFLCCHCHHLVMTFVLLQKFSTVMRHSISLVIPPPAKGSNHTRIFPNGSPSSPLFFKIHLINPHDVCSPSKIQRRHAPLNISYRPCASQRLEPYQNISKWWPKLAVVFQNTPNWPSWRSFSFNNLTPWCATQYLLLFLRQSRAQTTPGYSQMVVPVHRFSKFI